MLADSAENEMFEKRVLPRGNVPERRQPQVQEGPQSVCLRAEVLQEGGRKVRQLCQLLLNSEV